MKGVYIPYNPAFERVLKRFLKEQKAKEKKR